MRDACKCVQISGDDEHTGVIRSCWLGRETVRDKVDRLEHNVSSVQRSYMHFSSVQVGRLRFHAWIASVTMFRQVRVSDHLTNVSG